MQRRVALRLSAAAAVAAPRSSSTPLVRPPSHVLAPSVALMACGLISTDVSTVLVHARYSERRYVTMQVSIYER